MTNGAPEKNAGVELRPYRDLAVGRPADHASSSMAQEEREAYRKTVEKLGELVKKAAKGTKEAASEIRAILEEHPRLSWKISNLSRLAEGLFIQRMSRDEDLAAKESMKRQLACMREGVAGATTPPP